METGHGAGVVDPEGATVAQPRLAGLDIARALAFAGMLLAHFAVSDGGDPRWLRAIDDAADGRAAPLFCVLLGLGAGMLLARGRSDAALLGRACALFVLGLVLWPLVPQVFVILPHYGVLLALVVLLRRLSDRALLVAAALAFLVPSLVVAIAGTGDLRVGGQPARHVELLDVPEVVAGLAWTGGYPLVGWVGFVAVGLALARLPLAVPSVQRRLVGAGVLLAALQPLVAAGWARSSDPLTTALLDSRAHSNQLAWYLLASGSAVAVIGACLLAAGRGVAVLRPLQRLGQVMLSAYVAHLGIGVGLVWPWHDGDPPLAAEVLVVLAVLATFLVVADRWVGGQRRGPIEAVLRTVAP